MKKQTIQTLLWGTVAALVLVLVGCDPILMKQGVTTQVAGYTATASNSVAPPTISPATGTYSGDQQVVITTGVPNGVIHYTLDGTTPTSGSAAYTAPITVSGAGTVVTVKAIVTNQAGANSAVVVAIVTIGSLPTSLVSAVPAAGAVVGANGYQNIVLTFTKPVSAATSASNFSLTGSAVTNLSIASVTANAGVYTLAVSGVATSGTAVMTFVNLVDAQGHAVTGSYTFTIDVTPPALVTSVTAVGSGSSSTSEVVSFTPPTDADYAQTQITFTPAAAGVTQPISVPKGQNTATISGLAKSTTYSFSLKAVDALGNASAAVVASGKTEPVVSTLGSGISGVGALAIDGAGNVYFMQNTQMMKIVSPTGDISSVSTGYLYFNGTQGIAVNAAGTQVVYTDPNLNSVNYLTKSGGTWTLTSSISYYHAINATTSINPWGVLMDASGTVYFGNETDVGIRTVSGGTTSLFANFPTWTNPPTNYFPASMSMNSTGTTLVVSEEQTYELYFFDVATKTYSFGVNFLNPANQNFYGTRGVAFDGSGNLYTTEDASGGAVGVGSTHQIFFSTAAQLAANHNSQLPFTVFAGQAGVSTQVDGPLSMATFKYPDSLAFDSSGNLYVSDSGTIRKITF